MANKTIKPSMDKTADGDGDPLCRTENGRQTIFTPSNRRDERQASDPPSQLQLSDFHSLVRASSAAIACFEFSEAVSTAILDARSFSERVFNANSVCLEASDSFARMRGFANARHVLQKQLRDLLPPTPGTLSLIAEWHRRSFTADGFEWQLADYDDRPALFHVAIYGSFSEMGLNRLWLVLRDISALARAINATAESERHYRALLDREDIVYVRAYADGTISRCSEGTRREFHATTDPTSNIDHVLNNASHPEDRELVERISYHRRSLSREPLFTTLRLVGKTGGLSTYRFAQHPHLMGGDVDAFDLVGIASHPVYEIGTQGLLSSGLAHDANNQLMIASSSIERALRVLPPGHASLELLESALSSISLCAKIQAQAVRLSSGLRPTPERVDVTLLFADVVRQCEASLPDGVTLVSSPQNERVWAWADRSHLNQALVNLILNAKDALGHTGVITLSATRKAPPGQTSEKDAPRQVCLSVSDNGPGISASVKETLFQPFVSTKASGRTRGLGLTMVKTLIEMNGGGVSVTSAQDLGTTCTLSIPEAPTAEIDGTTRGATTTSELGIGTMRHLRVIIADDEAEVRKSMIFSLVAHGAEATAVADFTSLLNEISRAKQPYNLVILDDGMPGSTAEGLCAAVHALAPNTPVIVTSGNPSLAEELPDRLNRRFIPKPFTMADLEVAIESVFHYTPDGS